MSDIPEWLKNEVSEFYYGNPVDFMNGVKKCFDVLSKPENQANLPEVKALVDACKPVNIDYVDTGTGDEFTKKGLDEDKIKEALKPFEGV